jgi:ribosomal protein L29
MPMNADDPNSDRRPAHSVSPPDPDTDRRVPTNTQLLEALWELRRDLAVLKTQQATYEKRTNEHDCALDEIKQDIRAVSENLERHMLKEEQDRAELFRRVTWILAGVVLSSGALIVDLIINYLKG